MNKIHSTAIVNPRAELGDNVSIGPFTIVEEDVMIGDNCQIQSHTLLASGSRLGKEIFVGKGAVLGTKPQDLKFKGEKTNLEIGDGTVIREFATLNRGTSESYKTVIGKDCFIMAYAHVAHDCVLGDHVIIANAVNMGGHVIIEDYAGVGGLTAIHQFVHIGRHSFVGGGMRVTMDVPPYILATGEPIRYAGTNHVGLKRRGFSKETILEIKRAYRIIYKSSFTVSEAIKKIEESFEPIPEIQNILRFAKNSQRGLIRG